jgi:cyd operon protein YbgT
MWYFAWILGTLLACSAGIITALAFEQSGKRRRITRYALSNLSVLNSKGPEWALLFIHR